MLSFVSGFLFLIVFLCSAYFVLVALAGFRPVPENIGYSCSHRFAIAIPAHNEADVIGFTVSTLKRMNYPKDLYDVFVVADFCSDRTAEVARDQGAVCYERVQGERGGKGSALSWLFERIFDLGYDYDAVVIFDADTQVDADFLKVLSYRLERGSNVIQGKHVISNPRAGWFPALTWAMMTIDNRLFSYGRTILKLSARHLGDSICLRSDILKRSGWGGGLTEDYELRLKLLLEGIRIEFEPSAIGRGQAPVTWKEAQVQRMRWARGVMDTGKRYRKQLLREGIQQGDLAKLDGGLSASLPSYTSLSLLSICMLLLHLSFPELFTSLLTYLWACLVLVWFLYPLVGLALEKAPVWAYMVILSGPLFMLWRSWIKVKAGLSSGKITWVRTKHRNDQIESNFKS
jgi:cellulose synthase/poly-beta-1,6-N-acetylglucosamine synthase-like glycosyltransferase